jgi:hypothetical protein
MAVAVLAGLGLVLAVLLGLSRKTDTVSEGQRPTIGRDLGPSVASLVSTTTSPIPPPPPPELAAGPRPPGEPGDDDWRKRPLAPRDGPELDKDPNGPARDWRDFNEEERAAQSSLEHDLADIGLVTDTLEAGVEVERVRGTPPTPEEQQQMRAGFTELAGVYEKANDDAYHSRITVTEFSQAMRDARDAFDAKVKRIYGLSDEQFFDIFPHRREIAIGKP